MPKNNIHPIQIQDVTIPNNLWLAPLAGYSHKALRLFAKRYGAGYAVTEMVSLEGLVREDKKTLKLLDVDGEGQTTVQLFGKNEPEKFYKASRFLQSRIGARIIDVNFGCPVRKVIRNEAGSHLLRTPEAMSDIIKALKDSGVIASAKIRTGFDTNTLEQSMEALNKAGADIITLHPRLAIQFYNGTADWNQIKLARKMTNSVLIASGDINTPEDAEAVFEQTGVDGIMIGRRAVGAAYIFRQILDYFQTGTYKDYSLPEIKEIMIDYAKLFKDISKKDFIVPVRSALIQYVRIYKNSKEIRNRLAFISSIKDLEDVLKDW